MSFLVLFNIKKNFLLSLSKNLILVNFCTTVHYKNKLAFLIFIHLQFSIFNKAFVFQETSDVSVHDGLDKEEFVNTRRSLTKVQISKNSLNQPRY